MAIFGGAGALGDEPVTVLISSRGPYQTAADQAVAELKRAGVACRLVVVDAADKQARRAELTRLKQASSPVVVAGGAALTVELLEAVPAAPVVSMMTPNAADASFVRRGSQHGRRVAVVTSDVDPQRQVDWIMATEPDCKRVAVLCSSRTQQTADAIRDAAARRRLEIIPIQAKRDKFPAAIDALNSSSVDGVLMIPDSWVYNSPNVQRLLLWGVRQKRPVWAFSPKIVKAGALAGVYSDPTQVGAETARVVQRILDGASPDSIGLRYLNSYGRAVNLHTAERIGVKLSKREIASDDVTKFGKQ